jgi:hypothetical protein
VWLPPGTTAFGADFAKTTQLSDPQVPAPFTAQVTLSDGSSYTFDAANWPALTFWGFTSDSPVASLVYSDGGAFHGIHYEVLDNVAFGVAAVPEPAALGLVLLAGAALAVSRANRRTSHFARLMIQAGWQKLHKQ